MTNIILLFAVVTTVACSNKGARKTWLPWGCLCLWLLWGLMQ